MQVCVCVRVCVLWFESVVYGDSIDVRGLGSKRCMRLRPAWSVSVG